MVAKPRNVNARGKGRAQSAHAHGISGKELFDENLRLVIAREVAELPLVEQAAPDRSIGGGDVELSTAGGPGDVHGRVGEEVLTHRLWLQVAIGPDGESLIGAPEGDDARELFSGERKVCKVGRCEHDWSVKGCGFSPLLALIPSEGGRILVSAWPPPRHPCDPRGLNGQGGGFRG